MTVKTRRVVIIGGGAAGPGAACTPRKRGIDPVPFEADDRVGGRLGGGRASAAIEEAVRSPLLEGVNPSGARGVTVNITAAPSVGACGNARPPSRSTGASRTSSAGAGSAPAAMPR